MLFWSGSWEISNSHPRASDLSVYLQTKKMNEDFSSEILNFLLKPSTNQRAGSAHYRKCDSAKDSSRKQSNAMKLLKLRVSGNADDCCQLKAHRKTDAIA